MTDDLVFQTKFLFFQAVNHVCVRKRPVLFLRDQRLERCVPRSECVDMCLVHSLLSFP